MSDVLPHPSLVLRRLAGGAQATLAVRKQTNVGFNNCLEISWRAASGKRKSAFLTSFLSRNEALRLILYNWQQCRCAAAPPCMPRFCHS